MYNYVFVIGEPEETAYGEAYGEEDIGYGLPGGCDYIAEVPLKDVPKDDLFGALSPVLDRSEDRINVRIRTRDVREYLLNRIDRARSALQSLREHVAAQPDDVCAFYRASSALRDPLDLRIQYDDLQDDVTSWLYEMLVRTERTAEEDISFSITQAFQYRY